MSDAKLQLIEDVTHSLVGKMDRDDIELVSDEMTIALRDYEVTKHITDLVKYDGANELIVKRYKACMVISGKSPKTIAQYERIVVILFRTLQKNYTDMTVSDLRYFLALEKSRGVSNRTLENTRLTISTFFAWLMDEELISKNPCRQIAKIKYEQKVRLPFSAVELDAIRSACNTKKERAIVEFLLSTGVRVSELCTICLSDINFDTLTIKVREGKGSKQRTVFMNDLAKKHVVSYIASRDNDGPNLFYNQKNAPLEPGGVRFILKQIEERSGVQNIHPHRFRRTFATGLANRGMEIQEIAKLLGHANVNTTLEYVYTSDEKVMNSYRKYIA